MASRKLILLKRCDLVLPTENGGSQTIPLSSKARPTDLQLLILIATKTVYEGSCTRTDCIRLLWPDYEALVQKAAAAVDTDDRVSLLEKQRTELARVNKELDRAIVRLKKVLDPEMRLPKSFVITKARDLRGTLGLHLSIETDIGRVAAVLQNESLDPAEAVKLIQGELVSVVLGPFLDALRNEFAENLDVWFSRNPKLRDAFNANQRRQIISELLLRGVSPTYSRIPLAQRVNGRMGILDPAASRPRAGHVAAAIETGDLTKVACDTFADLLKSWLGAADSVDYIPPSTVFAALPSNWNQVDPIPIKVDIVVCEDTPEIKTINGEKFLGLRLDQQRIRALRDAVAASDERSSYIALALPAPGSGARETYYDRPARERFEWWIVNGRQCFESPEAHAHSEILLFPQQNKWRLSLCALLWSSRWVENFYVPLSHPLVGTVDALRAQIEAVYTARPDIARLARGGWDGIEHLPASLEHLHDPVLSSKVSFAVGLGTAMQLIIGQLTDPSLGGQTQIRTYTPEALFGTVSMWLFSRSYHQFMELSRPYMLGKTLEVNQRLLPVVGQNLTDPTRLHRVALWLVTYLYRWYGADTRLIPEPADRSSADRAWYGKSIGNFRWLYLNPDGAVWEVGQGEPAVQDAYFEFFEKHAPDPYIDHTTSETNFARAAALHPADVAIEALAPKWLFPLPSPFLEQPSLWPISGPQLVRLNQARAGELKPLIRR